MKICVAGLGLIGGSLSMALRRAGYNTYGFNRSQKPLEYAVEHGIVGGVAENLEEYDVVFVALPPKPAVEFILKNKFKSGAVVADICGVKKYIEDAVYKEARGIRYIGTHPMAGKEVSGVENACADLFDNASMVITRGIYTDESALNVIKTLTKEMGFARIVECSAEVHDRKIAYTSQLAHVVSNCYVNDPEIDGSLGFTGGSFQDMTRIAGVDENVWTELFFLNSENLTAEIKRLCTKLTEYATSLEANDEERMKKLLTEGKRSFAQFEKSK